PAEAEALDAPRMLDGPGNPDALGTPGALTLDAPEEPWTLNAPEEPRALERDPAGAVDVADALRALALPATLGMLEHPNTLGALGRLDELDGLETLEAVSIALFVAGCFVMVMGTATTAVERTRRAMKRITCCRVLMTGVGKASGGKTERTRADAGNQ
ncbi:hypothetical protein GGG16DRAFT_51095, partial [Schizophyllum commune]